MTYQWTYTRGASESAVMDSTSNAPHAWAALALREMLVRCFRTAISELELCASNDLRTATELRARAKAEGLE